MSQEAIQAVGFTDDGMVGMLIRIEIDGQQYAANIAMNPDYTENLSKTLLEAARQAREKFNVRNGANNNKGKPTSH